jgi:hypothetical protein
LGGGEEVEGEGAVVAALQCAVEYLLNDVVDDVVQEVVPGEAEEEVLDHTHSINISPSPHSKQSREAE